MPKVLKLVVVSLGVLVLSSAVGLAQAPTPPSNPTPAPTTGQAKHKSGSKKKGGRKKGGKKNGAKKTPQ